MRFLSVCSGIEAASVAWNPLGWDAAAFAEIEPFPCAVLAHHYPGMPNLGDMTRFQEWPDLGSVDLLCGGTPCQSFSVAGLRGGLADPRGDLMLTFGAIAARLRPEWLVWENVPGVLSSNGGRDFGSFLGLLGELGYGFAYRVLDAQYFGLAQRRKRVFVVGCLGSWQRAAAVLFERHSLQGHPAPGREAREDVAGSLAASTGGSDENDACDGRLIPERARALTTSNQRIDAETETLLPVAFSAKDHSADAGHLSPTLRAGTHSGSHANGGVMPAVLVPGAISIIDYTNYRGERSSRRIRAMRQWHGSTQYHADQQWLLDAWDFEKQAERTFAVRDIHAVLPDDEAVAFQASQSGVRTGEAHATLDSNNGSRRHHGALVGMQVRRLTPRECERLQGFPDDYTAIKYRGKPAADGPRYKALGNSWAVPCVRWIGERIALVNAIGTRSSAAMQSGQMNPETEAA